MPTFDISGITSLRSRRKETQTVTRLKYWDPCHFNLSVQFLRSWKPVKMNNGHSVGVDSSFKLEQTLSASLNRSLFSLNANICLLVPQPLKEDESWNPIVFYKDSQNTSNLFSLFAKSLTPCCRSLVASADLDPGCKFLLQLDHWMRCWTFSTHSSFGCCIF